MDPKIWAINTSLDGNFEMAIISSPETALPSIKPPLILTALIFFDRSARTFA